MQTVINYVTICDHDLPLGSPYGFHDPYIIFHKFAQSRKHVFQLTRDQTNTIYKLLTIIMFVVLTDIISQNYFLSSSIWTSVLHSARCWITTSSFRFEYLTIFLYLCSRCVVSIIAMFQSLTMFSLIFRNIGVETM